MKYQTEMMRAILQNETAQEIIDYVSRIYGESYVALWIYEAIGTALSEAIKLADALRDEAGPGTSDFLLDYWEDHYGLPRDSTLTTDQRRARLLQKIQDRAPINPAKLAKAISDAVGGAPTSIDENTAKNTFEVTIQGPPTSIDRAWSVLNRKKPAHLLVNVNVQIPFIETERFGGCFASIVRMPVPAIQDKIAFTGMVRIGAEGMTPVLTKVPIPEIQDSIAFAGRGAGRRRRRHARAFQDHYPGA